VQPGVCAQALLVGLLAIVFARAAEAAAPDVATAFHAKAEPILTQYCARCHNNKLKKGSVTFDVDETQLLSNKELWLKAIKMLRAGMMPPRGKDRPSADEIDQFTKWVKYSALGIDPHNPDPGRVTLRRLNRTEYRNTIRDLMGVDFDAAAEFPADDTGHGFDNLSDVLTISPLLLEKYVTAAKTIVGQAVPTQPRVPAERRIPGQQFKPADGKPSSPANGSLALSYYKPATVGYTYSAKHADHYQLVLDLSAHETFVDGQFDRNRCRAVFKCGEKVLLSQEFSRQGGKPYRFEFDLDWPAGNQEFSLSIEPLTPKESQVRSLTLRLNAVIIRGPLAKEHWGPPANYARFFPGTVPADSAKRHDYAGKLLENFAARAFRRPVDAATVERLVRLAEATAAKPGQTFESGIAQAMIVVLASPRFLFREEETVPGSTDKYPLLNEYALASRLSYFLWSSMPDEELFRLAAANQLRANLSAQVTRMLSDRRSGEFVRNFAGQWLQSRSIESVNINEFAVLAKDRPPDPQADARRARFRELIRKDPETLTAAEKKELAEIRTNFAERFRRVGQFRLTGDLRRALRQETELTFDYIVRNDRSLLELIDSNYTFLNERLAGFYEIEGVKGTEMRKVTLPANSPRGGLLTQGTFLMITSNPDRTSPVKRGLYIQDTVLGMPPPPPPPDIQPLENAVAQVKGKPPTLRESLKIHRSESLCASCHARMDPLGLAFENFNALGRWRDKELNQPIEAGGELLTGERFKDVRELKRILISERRLDFYRCATEKLLIYALGRGPEPTDLHTVDEIVAQLEAAQGRPSVLIRGIISAPAFQRTRQRPE
jgi:hypothetical protein